MLFQVTYIYDINEINNIFYLKQDIFVSLKDENTTNNSECYQLLSSLNAAISYVYIMRLVRNLYDRCLCLIYRINKAAV